MASKNGAATGSPTLIRSIRENSRVVFIVLSLSTSILLTGYDNVILNSTSGMPAFQEDFGTVLDGKPFIPSLWLGLWTGAGPIGAIIGAVCAGRLQDLLGRRASLITGTLISSIAIAACFVANLAPSLDTRRGVFLAVNLVEGIGTTMIYCTAQTYISEVAPVLLRSTLLTCLPVFTLLGQLLGAIVTFALLQVHGSWSYRAAYASQWILSAVVLLVAILIPESPVFLIRKSSLEEARAAQFRLCPASVNDDFACLMRTIQNEVDSHGGEKVGYRDCFKGTNHRRTWIVVFANCIPILFGLPLLANSSYFLQIVGLVAGDAFRVLIIGIAVGMMANFVAMWTLSHFGRRPLIIVSLVTAGALWTSVGIAGFWDSSISAWYTGGAMIAIVLVCGSGAWPTAVVVASETSSLQLRALTQGVGAFANSFSNGVLGTVLPYIFNPDAGNLRGKTGFLFSGLCKLAVVATWLWVPEMKERTAAEIDEMFEVGLAARQFKKWDIDEDKEGDTSPSSNSVLL